MELYKKGSFGLMVQQIQKALAGAGLGVYPDGKFGSITEEAVKEFQRTHGLTPDGIVGPATLAKLLPLRIKKSKRTITDIVVHCTATRGWQDFDVDAIRRIHRANGWSDIGYHYLVRLDGTIQNGRDVDIIGAHVEGHNSHSIGIAYVGGLNNSGKATDTRTENQKAALRTLLRDLRELYPKAIIKGHRDYSTDKNGNGIVEPSEWIKSCPCFDTITEYIKL